MRRGIDDRPGWRDALAVGRSHRLHDACRPRTESATNCNNFAAEQSQVPDCKLSTEPPQADERRPLPCFQPLVTDCNLAERSRGTAGAGERVALGRKRLARCEPSFAYAASVACASRSREARRTHLRVELGAAVAEDSAIAARRDRALRYERSVVIALNASQQATMRATSGICLAGEAVRVASAVPALVARANDPSDLAEQTADAARASARPRSCASR